MGFELTLFEGLCRSGTMVALCRDARANAKRERRYGDADLYEHVEGQFRDWFASRGGRG